MQAAQSTFNKEKATFLAAALFCSLALYGFLGTAPVPLEPAEPIASESFARLSLNTSLPGSRNVDEFIRGDHNSPFLIDWPVRPARPIAQGRRDKDAGTANSGIQVPTSGVTPPQPQPEPKKDPQSAYDYMGVVLFDGASYGLLRPKDGSPPLRVRPGEQISEMGCTVTKVEPQRIWIEDASNNRFLLKASGTVRF